MTKNITIREGLIEIAVAVNATIIEFEKAFDKAYFEDRYANSDKLIIIAYVDTNPAGYMVSYDKDKDGSLYCWMAGVNPKYRRLGVLKKLMHYVFDWAKSHGYQKITIKTRNNRREMLHYLLQSGFNFTEVQQQPSIEENRILLEKMVT